MAPKLEEIPFEQGTGSFLLTLLSAFLLFIAVLSCATYESLKITPDVHFSADHPGFILKLPVKIDTHSHNPDKLLDEILSQNHAVVAYRSFYLKDLIPFTKVLGVNALDRYADVRISPGAGSNLTQLKEDIDHLIPGVQLFDRQPFLQKKQIEQSLLENVILFFTSLMILSVMVAAAFIARSHYYLHERIIEILSLLGASGAYVNKKFQEHFFFKTLKGGCWGALVALTIVTLIGCILVEHQFLKNWIFDQFVAVVGVLCVTLLAVTFTVRLTVYLLMKNAY